MKASGAPDYPGLMEGAGAGLIFLGAYVPWVVTFAVIASVPVRGVDTDYGRIVPLIPLAALALLSWRWYARAGSSVHLFIIALGVFAIALALVYAVQAQRNVTRARETLARSGQLPGTVNLRFDVGMYLTIAGGAAMCAGGVLGIAQDQLSRRTMASK